MKNQAAYPSTLTIKSLRAATILCCLLVALLVPYSAKGQDNSVAVPDLTGLNVPQAAAALNTVGLLLGEQNNLPWTEASGMPANTISAQSAFPGTAIPIGTAVNVNVLRPTNVTLIYDENDFTLHNHTGGDLNLRRIVFNAVEGTNQASFEARRWTRTLGQNLCAQLWSVTRYEPKDIEGCGRIQNWLVSARDVTEHFWTQMNGVTSFNIVVNDVERATCPAAPEGSEEMRCEVFVPINVRDEVTPYVYFAYTPQALIVLNQSEDQWMLLDGMQIASHAPAAEDAPFAFADPAEFGNPQTFGLINQLAPGQCLLYTKNTPDSTNTPKPCNVIAHRDMTPNVVFWSMAFGVDSVTSSEAQTCPPATDEHVTVCIMPR